MQNFIDTSNIEGRFEFSEWVRAYGKYLDEQLEVFSKIQFYQVCHASHELIGCTFSDVTFKYGTELDSTLVGLSDTFMIRLLRQQLQEWRDIARRWEALLTCSSLLMLTATACGCKRFTSDAEASRQ